MHGIPICLMLRVHNPTLHDFHLSVSCKRRRPRISSLIRIFKKSCCSRKRISQTWLAKAKSTFNVALQPQRRINLDTSFIHTASHISHKFEEKHNGNWHDRICLKHSHSKSGRSLSCANFKNLALLHDSVLRLIHASHILYSYGTDLFFNHTCYRDTTLPF